MLLQSTIYRYRYRYRYIHTHTCMCVYIHTYCTSIFYYQVCMPVCYRSLRWEHSCISTNLYYPTLSHTKPYITTQHYHTTPHHMIQYNTTQYDVACRLILYCTVLYYTVLYYTTPHYTTRYATRQHICISSFKTVYLYIILTQQDSISVYHT